MKSHVIGRRLSDRGARVPRHHRAVGAPWRQVAIAGDGQVSHRPDRGEGRRAQGPQAPPRPRGRGLRGRGGRRLHAVRALRGQARGVSREPAARRGRAGQGLAHATACCAGSRRCWWSPTRSTSFIVSGTGDVIEPDDGLIGIGSGGPTRWPRRARWSPTPSSTRRGDRVTRGACASRPHLHLHQRPASRWRSCDAARDAPDSRRAQIVAELDRYIVGQHEAKRAVAIALRNRWRRQSCRPSCATRSRRRTSS